MYPKPILLTALFFLAACHNPSTPKTQGGSSRPAVKAVATPSSRPKKDTIALLPPMLPFYLASLNNDSIADTIFLTPTRKNAREFTSIAISIAGHSKQTFKVSDTTESWTLIDGFDDSIPNDLKTREFFLKKTPSHAFILLFGWLGETSRQGFSIIRIKNDTAKMVMDAIPQKVRIELIEKLADLDGDGRYEFINRNSFDLHKSKESGLDSYIGPYSPYYVYTIDDSVFLNKPLMKEYNEKHYLFAGYEYRGDIDIVYPEYCGPGGAPYIWKH